MINNIELDNWITRQEDHKEYSECLECGNLTIYSTLDKTEGYCEDCFVLEEDKIILEA